MTKLKFLLSLHEKLSGLPQDDVEERISFYSEMIEDRIEEGLTEEEAVAVVGTVDEVAAQIEADIKSSRQENAPADAAPEEPTRTKRRLSVWEIVLIILGCPVWLSLLIAAFATVLSLYVSLWAVIVSLWAVFGSLIACAVGCVVGGILLICFGHAAPGIAAIGAGLVCAGLSIFLYFGCMAATKCTALLAKWAVRGIKKIFAGKERA